MNGPDGDPAFLFEHFRGSYGTELLTAAVAHLDVFGKIARSGAIEPEALRLDLGLESRPFVVLTTALRAMGLLSIDGGGRLMATPAAREFLTPGGDFDLSGYIGLAAGSPGVSEMLERLRTNRPAGGSDKPEEEREGAAFIYREGLDSAMEREDSARRLTLSLAGRARVVAPALAARHPLPDARRLVDVGGGSGLYAIAYLRAHPTLHAVVWDRPEVLKIAAEMAARHGVADRLECVPGDMFADPVPSGDVHLLSNILHDWDAPECRELVARCASALPRGGTLLVHDVFLDDDLGGPLPIALYSAALFTLTEGRAYSAREYRDWLTAAGLRPGEVVPTTAHCGVLASVKSA